MQLNKQIWEGPYENKFSLFDKTHSNVLQYRLDFPEAPLGYWAYYIPKPYLESVIGNTEWPEAINVEIRKTFLPIKEIGFTGDMSTPRANPEYWEYDYRKNPPQNWENGSGHHYEVLSPRHTLWIPKQIMEELQPPSRIAVRVTAGVSGKKYTITVTDGAILEINQE